MTNIQQKLARTYEEDGYSATLTFWAENQDEINALSEKERTALKNMMSRYCRINGDEKNAAIVLAEKENPQSKESIAFFFDFARIYHCGKNVEKDETKSKTLCRMIFEQGDSDDLYRLGLMYKSGDGVSQDYAKAAECFQKVAVAGNKIAQFLLAEMYMRGLGVEKSRAEAEKWYTSANEEKDRYSAGLSHMTIPDGIEVIEESAFEGFDDLRSVVIPESVKRIGDRAFKGCRNLESVKFSDDSIVLGFEAFEDCPLNEETKELINKTNYVFIKGNGDIKDFYIGRFPVTQDLYEEVMGTNPSHFKGARRPVESVSWYDAVYFCNKLSEKFGYTPVYEVDGKTDVSRWGYEPNRNVRLYGNITQNTDADGFRLPTNDEWKYAARGGRNYIFAGSDDLAEVGWYRGNSRGTTHPVGKKKPNDYGLYDMSGNVNEWLVDSYNYYCGGSWFSYWDASNVGFTGRYAAGMRSDDIVFRVVRNATEK